MNRLPVAFSDQRDTPGCSPRRQPRIAPAGLPLQAAGARWFLARASFFATLLAVVTAACMSGCWSRHEVESLALIVAAGVDYEDTGTEPWMVTVQIAKPFAIAGGMNQITGQEKSVCTLSSCGKTVAEAARNLFSESPRMPYWGHNLVFVVGEKAAKNGMNLVLDVLLISAKPRRTAYVIVVKGGTARDFLRSEFELERIPANGYRALIDQIVSSKSSIPDVDLNRYAIMLETEGVEPVAIAGEIVRKSTGAALGDASQISRQRVDWSVCLRGAAVFEGDKLVGWLSEAETRGYNWIAGRAKGSMVVAPDPGDPDRLLTLDITRTRSNLECMLAGGKPLVKVRINVEAFLAELQDRCGTESKPVNWSVLESSLADVVRREATAAADRARELGCDIFGIGAAINRREPRRWHSVRSQWQDLFRQTEFTIEVSAVIKRPGLHVICGK